MGLSRFFLFFILSLPVLAFGESQGPWHGCMTTHFRLAMALNQQRRELYSEETQGETLAISNELLRFEKSMLPAAQLADALAFPFQLRGVPLFCRELVSMKNVPPFQEKIQGPWPSLSDYHEIDLRKYRQQIADLLSQRDFSTIVEVTNHFLMNYKEQIHFHCLQRHFIESIALAASVADKQDLLARHRMLIGTKALSISYIRHLLQQLDETGRLDDMAAPYQAQGTPILCQDVPLVWH